MTSIDFLDLEVHIARGSGGDYQVVMNTPVGEHTGTLAFPLDTLQLKNALLSVELAVAKSGKLSRAIVTAPPETDAVTQFGRKLFEALFTGELNTALRRSQDRARDARKGLRLRMRIDAAELASLPWEFMYDPETASYVSLSERSPIVRHIELHDAVEPLEVEPPLSVLVLVASPSDHAGLDIDRERARIAEATKELVTEDQLSIKWLERGTWQELKSALRRGTYHVLHFVGHGGFDEARGEGLLMLNDDDGRGAPIGANDFAMLISNHRSLRLVVLNSCQGAKGNDTDVFSSTAAVLVRRGIPAVVGMQYEISDKAAIAFSRELYESLADGLPIDAAVGASRVAIKLSAPNRDLTVEWGTPVLHMRARDGLIFKPTHRGTSQKRRSKVLAAVTEAPLETPTPVHVPAPAAVEAATKPAPPAAISHAALPAPRGPVVEIPPGVGQWPTTPTRTWYRRIPLKWRIGAAAIAVVFTWCAIKSGHEDPSPTGLPNTAPPNTLSTPAPVAHEAQTPAAVVPDTSPDLPEWRSRFSDFRDNGSDADPKELAKLRSEVEGYVSSAGQDTAAARLLKKITKLQDDLDCQRLRRLGQPCSPP